MTDKELIQMLCRDGYHAAAHRLEEMQEANEELLAENEHLREVTKMVPKWHHGEETPPMKKIEDDEDDWWESGRIIVVTLSGEFTVATAWKVNETMGWTDEVTQSGIAVKMWMVPEMPSTDGSE